MRYCKILMAGDTPALRRAADRLRGWGYEITEKPDAHVTHLMLPVPSFDPDGHIKGGGDLQTLLQSLPKDLCVMGGNLHCPALTGYQTLDLLHDDIYVSENAYITAHCAIRLALSRLPAAMRGCPVLVIGWGRIGKCLAAMLKGLEADVTVAARKEADRAMLMALGYQAVPIGELDAQPYRVIFNTVPVMVLPQTPDSALKIDLASQPGMGGDNILWARGLPGKDAPETSGELIAQTVARLIQEDTL